MDYKQLLSFIWWTYAIFNLVFFLSDIQSYYHHKGGRKTEKIPELENGAFGMLLCYFETFWYCRHMD